MRWLGRISLVVGGLALVATVVAGPGYQAGWWDLGTAFSKLFRFAAYGGLAALVLGMVTVVWSLVKRRPGALAGFLGLLAGFAAAAVPLSMRYQARQVPAIHDITTDVVNPPQFVAIAPLRADAPNPPEYDPTIAAEQKEAYPDITTIRVQEGVQKVFDEAVSVVESLGWELVDADREDGRIEATETTTWFGFKDDVVVRVDRSGAVTTVDVRSKSRVGRSDLGVNADRIREFRDRLLARLTSRE